ncbi:MAG: YkgJ family cysteine cluster protein [Clostridia bacterium]|nr:YkgJ family cysteine cluster protein [Clostridia bacterium]
MEISEKQFKNSKAYYKEQKMLEQLNQLYNQVPGGSCTGCAKCCTEAVQAFYVEFLNIHNFLQRENLLEAYEKKVETHYFSELYKRQDCPFLKEDKSCAIYPVRPLVCRMFGHSSYEEHEHSYQGIREMNEEVDQYFFDTYHVHIPEDVKHHKIEYCRDFIPEKVLKTEKRHDLIDRLFQMDTHFLMEEYIPEDAINLSITNWFVYLQYSEAEASKKRVDEFLKNVEK